MNERLRAVRRGRPAAHRAPHRDRLPRRARRLARRRAGAAGRRARREGARAVDRAARQRRRGAARARAPRRGGRRRDRPDERPRPAQRLRARRADASSRPTRCAPPTPTTTCAASARARVAHVGRHPRCCRQAGAEAFDYGNALRGLAADARRRGRVRLPRLRPRLHPPAVLRGQGAVPLGGAVGRPGRHRTPPTRRSSTCSATRSTSRAGSSLARERVALPGPARAHLLAGLRRAPPAPGCASTRWSPRGELRGADRHRPRPPRRRARSPRPSARPRRCATARTRSPTGRCSTRWSTRRLRRVVGLDPPRRRRRHGARRSTPARCAWPTAPPAAGERIRRVLTADPGMGIVRHADAGYAAGDRGGRAQRGADADARSGVSVGRDRAAPPRSAPAPRRPAVPAPRPRRRARARRRRR